MKWLMSDPELTLTRCRGYKRLLLLIWEYHLHKKNSDLGRIRPSNKILLCKKSICERSAEKWSPTDGLKECSPKRMKKLHLMAITKNIYFQQGGSDQAELLQETMRGREEKGYRKWVWIGLRRKRSTLLSWVFYPPSTSGKTRLGGTSSTSIPRGEEWKNENEAHV